VLIQVVPRLGPTASKRNVLRESLNWPGQVRLFYIRQQTAPEPRCCCSECSIAKKNFVCVRLLITRPHSQSVYRELMTFNQCFDVRFQAGTAPTILVGLLRV